ncbi:MAG: 1-acyl-sn-glycerol-3-phosphate acyltransferase [Bacilli bacterium]|nr:1-acyl-sn-glycerol-3-phosphate acyltransferase [Bacilli bacterium]
MDKLHFIVCAIILGPRIIFARLTWLGRYARHPENTPIEKRYKKVRKLIIKIVKTLRLDIKVNHLDYLLRHEEAFLGISNHRNFFDPLIYIYLSEKPISFVAKKEAFKTPLLCSVLRAIDVFPIDRSDLMSQVRLFREVALRIKECGVSYYVFAEGTRMKNIQQIHTLPYKDGSIKPAYWAERDIIYSAMYGTNFVSTRKPKGFKKRNITLEFHEPLKYSDFKDKPTTEIMPLIEKQTNETLIRLVEENSSRNLK